MPSLESQAQHIADTYTQPAVGRISGLTDTPLVLDFLSRVAEGNYIETACKIAGLSKATVYRWLKEADEPAPSREPQRLFKDALEKAEGMAEGLAMSRVRDAGKDPRFWAAEMTFLERRHPDRWARRSEDSHTPKVVVQIGVKDSDVQVQIHTAHTESPSSLSAPVSMSLSEPMQPLALSDSND